MRGSCGKTFRSGKIAFEAGKPKVDENGEQFFREGGERERETWGCSKITYKSNCEKRLARTEISITYKLRSFRVF